MAFELAVVGASWGGIAALGQLARDLDPGSVLALAVALHRGADGPEGALVSYLTARCRLPVSEAEDKDEIEPGHLYLAPADYHLLVEPGRFALSLEAPVQHSRPSVDVLFESAAHAYGGRLVAAVLTGANDDGSRGIRRVKDCGGVTLAQDPDTAERREMIDAAIATGAVDRILTLQGIADALNDLGRLPVRGYRQ
ncbi:MAG: chemotaxis protein CheB [Egibacteraceae bacterium]